MKNFWSSKKVLVTGGAGFIGSFVSSQLLELGATVTVTYKSDNLLNIKEIKKDLDLVKADLTDLSSAKKVTKNKDIVLNLASRVAGIQFNAYRDWETDRKSVV